MLNAFFLLSYATLLKTTLQHRCFLENVAKFFRATFMIEQFWWLLWLLFEFYLLQRSIWDPVKHVWRSHCLTLAVNNFSIKVASLMCTRVLNTSLFCIWNLTQLLAIIILITRRRRYSEVQGCSVKKILQKILQYLQESICASAVQFY